eukprot:TRINITY_DN15092_c0_g1_i1.p2 TRINITY_DN15092_c0_g1~~TRINITY_DN15092_c0_g1_i1.p2  ORF type:complete len:101 (+),score=23.06 TRINITY_DN15092_c0_g1_i1:75-377(+)
MERVLTVRSRFGNYPLKWMGIVPTYFDGRIPLSPLWMRRGWYVMLTHRQAPAQREEVLTLTPVSVSYTHLRAHETVLDLVCRLLLEKKKKDTLDDQQITG